MELNLKGKTALVTGSTKGIGKAIAIELTKEGVNVLVNGRNKSEVLKVVEELKMINANVNPQNACANLINDIEMETLLNKFPDIDILVNNLGIYEIINYYDITKENLNKYIETNTIVAHTLSQHYIKNMIKQNFGRIIFIASEEAVMPSGLMAHYAMTKAMILSLSQSLSMLTIGTEVTSNTIMPGPTLSENVKNIVNNSIGEDIDFSEKEKRFVKQNIPNSKIQRFVRPEEIAKTVTFLSSNYASPFRGTTLRMDGGLIPTI